MKSIRVVSVLLSILFMASACSTNQKKDSFIGRNEITVTDGKLTPETLWAMGRIGNVVTSEDGKKIAYQVTYYSVEQNKIRTVIYTMNADGSDLKQITGKKYSDNSPVFMKDGRIAFLSNRSGSSQVWVMNTNGLHRKQLSKSTKDIEGFLFSPDEKHVLLVMGVPNPLVKKQQYEDLPKATGMIADDLMFRHWDSWTMTLPHPFIAEYNGNQISENTIDILEGKPFESPMLPFGGIEQFAWSPDSKGVSFTCRMKQGSEYAISTDSDIFYYLIDQGTTENLCKVSGDSDQNMGYDINPQYSPDGSMIAWQSMSRDGYESDRNRLYVMDLLTKKKWSVSEAFDSNVESFIWSQDGSEIYFIGAWHGRLSIFCTDLNGNIITVNNKDCDYLSLAWADKRLIASRQSMTNPTELFSIDIKRGLAERISHENDHIISQLDGVRVEERWIKTTDDKQMHTWVIYPPHFDATKKYPTLLFCEGGPQIIVSQFWSYRWNFRIMAANGYIIVAPNRRGLPGFGQEWNEEISGDYGGQCMTDLLTAIDTLSAEPYVDSDRLGCVGASFGGYSVYWLAGNHNGRFKAFIAHDGIFNTEQQYLETEEIWFPNWDLGGPYWEKNEKTARSYSNSPHLFVDRWDTPILCIHGEKDYRILYSQTVAAFTAARLRDIPAKLLLFPDENHWVLKPQNGILWQRTYFNWLDRWLK